MTSRKSFVCLLLAMALCGTAVFSGCGQEKNNEESSAVSSSEDEETDADDTIYEEDEGSNADIKKTKSEDEGPLPEIEDPTPDNEGEWSNDIFIYNNVAYEPFYGGSESAKEYADTISFVKKQLGNRINVYNVVVPTHTGVHLPDKFKDLFSDQKEYLHTIVSSYTADVIGVDAYNKIAHHRNEYLYFNSDHHWTGRGAYYAYRAFTDAADIEPVELGSLKSEKIEGYYGSMCTFSGRDDLKEDYVEYYYPYNYDNIECQCYDETASNGQDYMLLHTYAEGSNAYGVFLGGDQPLMVAKNPNGNGKKIAILKESYGNAFSPFICYTYSETHMIDFRSASFNLQEYLDENEITDVIIINNSMASATPESLDELKRIVGG